MLRQLLRVGTNQGFAVTPEGGDEFGGEAFGGAGQGEAGDEGAEGF
jgi:hypothetical protein